MSSASTAATSSCVIFSSAFSNALDLVGADRLLLVGVLELLAGVAAEVADLDPALLGLVPDDLHQLLAALLGERRERRGGSPMPSLVGEMPRSEAVIAFSIAPITFFS